jgi:hypothetical protein
MISMGDMEYKICISRNHSLTNQLTWCIFHTEMEAIGEVQDGGAGEDGAGICKKVQASRELPK